MQAILNAVTRRKGLTAVVVLLVIVGIIYARILGMTPDAQEDLVWFVRDYLPTVSYTHLTLPTNREV